MGHKVSHPARFCLHPHPFHQLSFLSTALFTLTPLSSFLFLLTAVSWRASASISPNAQLEISNLELAPDGFISSFVFGLFIARYGIDR